MSSQPDFRVVSGGRPLVDMRLQDRMEDFLDHLCAPLVGMVPYAERVGLREEARDHLDALIAEGLDDGARPEDALDAAFQEFGEPWRIGQSWVDEWCRGVPQSRLARFVGAATLRVFAWFGLASLVTVVAVQWMTLEPGGALLQPYVTLLEMLAPLAAGVLTGSMVRVRVVRSVAPVVIALAAYSAVVGLLMLPHREGFDLALVQLAWWLPAGCASALGAAALLRSHRRQRFMRCAR